MPTDATRFPILDPLPVADPLIERLRAGEPAAQEELVRAHGPRMLAVARRICGSEHDAEEALQEAFLCAFRKLGSFAGGARLSTWLHRIAINAALMRVRARGRRPADSIEDLLPDFDAADRHAGLPWVPPAPPGEALERAETCAVVRAAIDLLPPLYRSVLVLRDLEELSTAETARRLGIRVPAAKVRLHRARQALRTLLEDGLRVPVREALPT